MTHNIVANYILCLSRVLLVIHPGIAPFVLHCPSGCSAKMAKGPIDQKTMDIWTELQGFCSTTTAHGFVNFTGKSKTKRLFWGVICFGKHDDDFLTALAEFSGCHKMADDA